MTIEDFITKWINIEAPKIRTKYSTVLIKGELYKTVVFFLPKLTEWKSRSQKKQFYIEAKRVGIIRMPGRKRKWYHKTW